MSQLLTCSGSLFLTFAFSQQLFCHEAVLPVPQDEGEEGEDEGVQDPHDCQDVSPAHGAGPQAVFVRLLSAHPPDLVTIPAVGIDHTAQHQTHT